MIYNYFFSKCIYNFSNELCIKNTYLLINIFFILIVGIINVLRYKITRILGENKWEKKTISLRITYF